MQYVSEEITREVFLTYVQDFAHLVHGVWVIKSEMLYQGEHQTALRSARDLALCLITAGLPVRRYSLVFHHLCLRTWWKKSVRRRNCDVR